MDSFDLVETFGSSECIFVRGPGPASERLRSLTEEVGRPGLPKAGTWKEVRSA